jgi:hypothetical protein
MAASIEERYSKPPSTPSSVKMYRFTEIDKPGIPTISPVNRSTLEKIIRDLPPATLSKIWWGYSSPRQTTSSFVVIYGFGHDPNKTEPNFFFPALNKNCNVGFSPRRNQVMAAPDYCFKIPPK